MIKELKIYRHRVYDENIADPTVDIYEIIPNLDPKLVVETVEDDDGQLIAKQQGSTNGTIGTIRQINIDTPLNEGGYTNGKKFYTGTDLRGINSRFVGDYVYSIEITMTDPIIKWMKARIENLERILYGIPNTTPGFSRYVSVAKSKPSYYNQYTNRFTQEFINNIGTDTENSYGWDNTYSGKISEFLNVLSSFTSFDYGKDGESRQFSGLYKFLSTISSPYSGSPSGAETTFKIMEMIYNKILIVFASASKYRKPVDNPLVGADGKGQSIYLAAGSNPRREFKLNHKFNTEIQGGISHLTGYDYLSLQSTTQEDTSILDGLKRMSFGEYDSRVLHETNKLFPINPGASTSIAPDTANINIYKDPLADHDSAVASLELTNLEQQLVYFEQTNHPESNPNYDQEKQALLDKIETVKNQLFVTNIQGDVLNPFDSPDFTKYAYLSPSIVNFEETDSQNLLNGGSMVTDIQALNNTLLNIIKYNTKSGQEFDFPNAPVATGVGNRMQDKIIPEGLDNELKYDLLNLMSLRQATVLSTEDEANPSKRSTLRGGVVGGSTTAARQLTKDNVDDLNILYEAPDDNKKYDTVDIFSSTKDPVDILLAVTEQERFSILGKQQRFQQNLWTWEYYVENFEKTFHKEYQDWTLLSALQLVDSTSLDPYVIENSPLKRAPNHVKALMLHLDWTKDIIANPAFETLRQNLISRKPYAYNYDLSGQVYGVNGSNFFGVSSKAYEINGMTSYNQIYPKNKVIYQTPEFLSFFLLNYKNIVKIECLAGYENDNINNPIWQELTLSMIQLFIERKGNVLCRMMPYEKKLYGIERYKFTNLPIYNDHFIIDFAAEEVEVNTTGGGVETRVEILVAGKRRILTSRGQGDFRRTTSARGTRDVRSTRDARGAASTEERARELVELSAEDSNQTIASISPQGSTFVTPQPSAGSRNLDNRQSSNADTRSVPSSSGFGGGGGGSTSGGGYGGGGY